MSIGHTTAREAAQASSVPKTPFRFCWYISKPYRWWALGAVIFAAIGQVGGSIVPLIAGELTDGIAAAGSHVEVLEVVQFWGLVFIGLTFLQYVGWRASGFLGLAWITRSNAYAYRVLYDYITKHSHGYFIDRFAGALSNKISNASDGSQRLIDRLLWGVYPQIIGTLINAGLLWLIHPYISIGFIVFFVLMIGLNYYLVGKRRPHVVAFAGASSKLRGEGVDLLTNIAAARQYARRPFEAQRLATTVDDRRGKDSYQWTLGELIMVVNNTAAFLLTAAVIGGLFLLVREQAITGGDVVIALFVLFRVGHTFVVVGEMMNGFVRLYGDIEEGLKEVLIEHEITDAPDARPLKIERARIEWDDVTFNFGGNSVFTDFDLTIEPGQRVGLVGPSGAGKTTFVSLLLRQHELDSGAIRIDGQNIAEVTQDSLRSNIAVVPQEPLLFHRTIRENIAYGRPDASLNEIEAVARQSRAREFIKDLPDGYDTLVGERGVKLSGGQKQRIAIARAMLKNAPILLLDEATSALDSESEVAIQKALRRLMDGKTVVAIAHRLSTLREMDRIIVMEDGNIVEDGSHSDLLDRGGVYARLWRHQAGGFLQE